MEGLTGRIEHIAGPVVRRVDGTERQLCSRCMTSLGYVDSTAISVHGLAAPIKVVVTWWPVGTAVAVGDGPTAVAKTGFYQPCRIERAETADPIGFAQVHLDQDEAVANAAATVNAMNRDDPSGRSGHWTADEVFSRGTHWSYQADEHIALHDPDRSFREVQAGRRILARHAACVTDGTGPCWEFPGPAGLCRELADLLYRWSDDPGYDPTWMPEGLGAHG